MVTQRTTTQMLGAAACMVLGVGTLLLNAPVKAQAPGSTATTEAGQNTTQPPASSDLDSNFWVLVRDSTDPEAVQSYLYSFPMGKYAEVARQRLAMLREQGKTARASPAPFEGSGRIEMARTSPPSSAAPQAIPPAASENADVARALQRELKRLGCLNADADGVWGEKSRTALKTFVRHARLGVNDDEPNRAALDAALARQSRVCPLVCDDNEKIVGDRCVTVSKPRPVAKEPRREQPRRAWAERPAAQPSEPRANPNSGKRICFGAGRNEIVTCP